MHKDKHKNRRKYRCKYRSMSSKPALILIWKMETGYLSAKSASCCHYYGDNCLQRQTAVLCNADSGGDTLNMRHLYIASELQLQKKYSRNIYQICAISTEQVNSNPTRNTQETYVKYAISTMQENSNSTRNTQKIYIKYASSLHIK